MSAQPGALEILLRVLQARPEDFPPAALLKARGWLHTYAAKLPHKDRPHPHPPDDQTVAQFLSVAPWPDLERVLYDLMRERRTCALDYTWFTDEAIQRIHGVDPRPSRTGRAPAAALRIVPRRTQ